MFLFPLGEYAEVKSLDYLAILFLGFRGTSIQFSVVYSSTSNAWRSPFLYILTKICHFLSFWYSHSERYEMVSIVVLICVSLIVMLRIFSCACWPPLYLLGRTSVQVLCPFLSQVVFFYVVWILCIFWVLTLIWCVCKYSIFF